MTDPEMLSWLREQINWWLDYGRKNAARRPITPMRSHEMRGLIARCEAELGILDLYESTLALTKSPPVMPEGHPYAGKVSAKDYMDAKRELCVLEPVVSLLAAGYKHQPGWKAEWAS